MKTAYYRFFFFLLFFTGVLMTAESQIRLTGVVLNKGNEPLAGVLVDFGNGYARTVTGIDGIFSINNPDTLNLGYIRFDAFGYKVKRMRVNNGQKHITAILLDSLYNLKSVTVSVPKYGRFSDYSAQTVRMSALDVYTNPSSAGDFLANMRALPGVQSNDNDGRLIVQGGDPDESKVYINDLIVQNPYTISSKNAGSRSRFSPDLFDGVVLQSGGYNAEFGQALSGIVNLNTLDKDKLESKMDVNILSPQLNVAGILKRPSYAFRADVIYNNLGPYMKIVPDGYEWSKYMEQIAGEIFLTKSFSLKTKMTVQARFSSAGMNYSRYNVDSIRFNNDMLERYFYIQANIYYIISNYWSISLAGNAVVDELSATDVRIPGDRVNGLSIWNHNKLNLQYSNGKITNRTGLEYIHNPFQETYSLNQKYNLKLNNDLFAVYNDTKLFLNNNLSMSAGLRGEYSVYMNEMNISPRVYAAYQWDHKHIFSASWGEYYQLPSLDYLKFTDNLRFTSAGKSTLSYSYVYRNSKFQLDAYYKKYKRLVTTSSAGNEEFVFENDGYGEGVGADLFWKSNFKSFEYWLTYSYNDTKKKYDRYSSEVFPTYLSRHSANLTLKYWIHNPVMAVVGLGYNVSSGSPYYNPKAPYEQLGATPFRNRLDLSLSVLPKPWIIIHLACQNVTGYQNIYGYEYSQRDPFVRMPVANPGGRSYLVGVLMTFSSSKTENQLKSL